MERAVSGQKPWLTETGNGYCSVAAIESNFGMTEIKFQRKREQQK